MNRNLILLTASAVMLTGCLPGNETDSAADTDGQQSTSGCGSDTVCEAWLDTHNDRRAELNAGTVTDDGTDGTYPVPSTPLPMLVWNSHLAEVAQAHADACVYEHNSDRKDQYVAAGGENIYIGENIAVNYTSAALNSLESYAVTQTDLWWDEHTLWHHQTYQSGTINGAGHFTQMIWENTIEVGCGIASCPNMNPSYNNAAFGVCNYGPGGNYSNQAPYSID